MRDFLKRLNLSAIAIAVCAGALVVGVSAGAEARDDHWRHRHHDRYDRDDRRDRHVYHHYRNERPVIVDRRPIMVAPPVYQAAPVYQAPSGLNLNFTIPLQ